MRTALVYIMLFLVAIPWYWQWMPRVASLVVGGFPVWVLVSILGSAGVSFWTVATLAKPWPHEDDRE